MRRKLLSALWIAVAALLLCACQQASAIARQLDGYAQVIASQAGPMPTVTPLPESTPKPTYIPKVTPTPQPTVRPSPSLFPMPTPTAVPSASPSPSPSPSPSTTPGVSPTPLPTATAVPLPSYAPIPQSVPFSVATPTPAPTAEPEVEPEADPEPDVEPDSEPTQTPEPQPTPSVPSGTYASGQEIADFALQFVGYNYFYGGRSPETGFDCSGLVYYVYQQFGYTVNRTASDQSLNGVHVEHDALEPGDVLCFGSGGYIGHSGIYIGGGEYVHAQGAATGVVISPLSERGDSFEARRIL